MNKKQRALWIGKILDRLFPDPRPSLHYTDPYTLLIAVLLSAQCTDSRVNLITPILFSLASTPQEMVKLSIETIESIIRPCGLGMTKARAIWTLSRELIERHAGEVPQSLDLLEALSGVGHKTASVVAAQAFHLPAFPVDTHIRRCANRWGLSHSPRVDIVERDLKSLFPKASWNKRHLQIIHFARQYCPARNHHSEKCPICMHTANSDSG